MEDLIWLDFGVRGNNIILQEHQRPYQALRLLPFPEVQQPQIISFIGQNVKTRISRDGFGLKTSLGHNNILLQKHRDVKESQALILIADCSIHKTTQLYKVFPKGDINQHVIRWHHNLPQAFNSANLAHLLYTQILVPFSTVVCLFADDLGGLEGVARLLATWLITLSNRSLDLPYPIYARILVLVEWDNPGNTFDEKLAILDFNKLVRREATQLNQGVCQIASGKMSSTTFDKFLLQQLGHARVLPLPKATESQTSRSFRKLRARILHESHEIQGLRNSLRVGFSARHLEAFLHLACKHFASCIVTPFSFIQASRVANPISKELEFHIKVLLKMVPSRHITVFAVPIIASALCFDAFPPGSHRFQVDMVFKKLYAKRVENALLGASIDQKTSEKLIAMIESRFCQLGLASLTNFKDIAISHKEVLRSFQDTWKHLQSNISCFSCLSRKAGNPLSCQHSFCDACLMVYSPPESQWTFHVDKCPLCQARNHLSYQLKPYTAGVRALAIDGGDFGDLEALSTLEQRLDLPLGMRKWFDIVNSSGFGGLVALEVFDKDQSIKDCLEKLRNEKSFQSRREQSNGQKSRFSTSSTVFQEDIKIKWDNILTTQFPKLPRWSGGTNPIAALPYLKQSFGTRSTMFNRDFGGAKFAITVKRTNDLANCVFSNYNVSDDLNNPIVHIRSANFKHEIRLWTCARITALSKPLLGYQRRESKADSEMVNLTLHEQDNLWLRSGKSPDLLVVAGRRISRHIEFPWLYELRLENSFNIQRAENAMLASLFYIELIELPQFNETGFYCRALIRCRTLPSSPAYYSILDRLYSSRARFYYDFKSIPCVVRQTYNDARQHLPYSRHIEMSVFSMEDEIQVEIDGFVNQRRSISNCPYRVQQIINDQGLDSVFGHRDHRKRNFGPSPTLRRISYL